MMDFEQRKQEILRRSQRRIQARKKITRTVVTCVPVVLCVAVLSLWTMGGGIKAANDDGNKESAELPWCGIDMESFADSVTAASNTADLKSVQVNDSQTIRIYEDTAVLDMLHQILQQPDGTNDGEDTTGTGGVTLILTDWLGHEASYILTEAYLTGEGIRYQLTADQFVRICALLELES